MENRKNAKKETLYFGNDTTDNHERCIVHIDIDCFYAQVEMIRDPELRSRPLGIQQKNIVVTSNYVARAFGVGKCMLVAEALRLCPHLVLVRGEDLLPYRKMSNEIFSVLQSYGCPVEKLGMDENFLDVTEIVNSRLSDRLSLDIVGHLYRDDSEEEYCSCGCRRRLAIASQVAAEMRASLLERLRITGCAGIAHNKLLAKLATAQHKPDQQTTVLPGQARSLLATLGLARNVPGIGAKTAEALTALGLDTVEQLQTCDGSALRNTFSADVAAKLKNLSVGIDKAEVKMSGKPQSVGLEDSCRELSVESEVRARFRTLLRRLMALLAGETRRPGALRVTLRRQGLRASRHANLPPSLLPPGPATADVSDRALDKLMDLIMRLFRKLVDLSKPFHLTLIGLAFTKFQEVSAGKSSIANYLKDDVSVQAVMNLENSADWSGPSMDCSLVGGREESGPGEAEPSPKKLRRALSPGAGVGELRLARLRLSPPSPCPPRVDPAVFEELPPDVQEELRASWGRPLRPSPLCLDAVKKNKTNNTITRYFIPNKQ